MPKKIDYKEYFVAFLDILGFKEVVLSRKQADQNKIAKYFDVVEMTVHKLKENSEKSELGFIIISDSVILSMPSGHNEEENIDALRQLCIAVGVIQSELLKNKLWLRGGISNGLAYFDYQRNIVVGPGYINAYTLESNSAIFPRVILDNQLIPYLKFQSAQEMIEIVNLKPYGGLHYKNWNTNILFDWNEKHINKKNFTQDAALFIDYIPQAISKWDNVDSIVEGIRENIYLNEKIYNKYRWAIEYLKICLIKYKFDHQPETLLVTRKLTELSFL